MSTATARKPYDRSNALPTRLFPVAPLLEIARIRYRPNDQVQADQITDVGILAEGCKVHVVTALRWLKAGTLPTASADKAAVALNRHPGDVWPEWWSL